MTGYRGQASGVAPRQEAGCQQGDDKGGGEISVRGNSEKLGRREEGFKVRPEVIEGDTSSPSVQIGFVK